MTRPQKIFTRFGLVLSGLAIGLLLSEGILRIVLFSPKPDKWHVWPPGLVQHFEPLPGAMPGITGTSHFTINSEGFRALEDSVPKVTRVLCLGGSTTECLYLDDTETWPHLLGDNLNQPGGEPRFWVGNAGRSGHASAHHVPQMKYLLAQHPEIDVVVILSGGNDFLRRLDSRSEYSRPDFESQILEKAFLIRPVDFYSPFYKRLAIWHLLRRLNRRWQDHKYRNLVQDRTGEVYIKWREARKNAGNFRDTLPEMTAPLNDYVANLREIIRIAREKKVRLVFLTQPTFWYAEMPADQKGLLCAGALGNTAENPEYYSEAALSDGIRRFNEALIREAAAAETEYFDLATALPKDTTVFYDDLHFNESGARKVAAWVAWFLEGGQFPPPDTTGI